MHAWKKVATAVSASFLLAASASAQSMTVTPGVALQVGGKATITYNNPALANQTVVVLVIGGFPIPTIYEVQITLDERGNGTAGWQVVSGWRAAVFTAPGVIDVTVPIS